MGNKVSADIVDSVNSIKTSENSQTMDLLQADIASIQILKNENKEVGGNADLNIAFEENALLATTNPIGVSDEITDSDSSFDQISVYVVRKGDAISQIASMFDVSVNTILWANDMKKGDVIKEGDVLFILPVSGVKHIVTKGQTLKSIALKYGADIQDVASFNGIAENTALTVGEELIIPGGEIYVDGPTNTVPKNKTTASKIPTRNLAGYFINPVPGAIKTQDLHGKNAVDLAAPIGTPIYAAASGTVLLARMGWNGAYGNMVIIQHPNGTKTLYAHLSRLGSQTGQSVYQGQVIGYVGNSGRVRASKGGNGAHLHFEVYGAKNPGSNGSWAK